jgi:NDP-sugar pyrophosphorylase family protein
MLNIIIPLAGPSDIFYNAGYIYPKPLIEIKGRPMIEVVLENPAALKGEKRFIFIVKEEDCLKFHLDNTLRLLDDKCHVVVLKKKTSGALCSILMCIDLLGKEDELLVLNADQLIDMDFNKPLEYFRNNKTDSGVVTFPSIHPRWSYARVQEGKVVETAEKNPISNNAIAGFYYFKETASFFKNAFAAIRKSAGIDGNYFTSFVINEYILSNQHVEYFPLEKGKYFSFYSPQMITEFENATSQNFTGK